MPRDSTYQQYGELFERIANRHPSIAYFHEIDEHEIVSGQFRSKVKFPAFILEYPDLGFNDNRVNVNQVFPSGFAIVKQLTKSQMGNATAIRQILIDMQIIMLDCISYLRHLREGEDRKLMMDTNNLNMNKVGPIFDNCYGWRCDFNYQYWVNLNFYEDEWNEYNPNKFT